MLANCAVQVPEAGRVAPSAGQVVGFAQLAVRNVAIFNVACHCVSSEKVCDDGSKSWTLTLAVIDVPRGASIAGDTGGVDSSAVFAMSHRASHYKASASVGAEKERNLGCQGRMLADCSIQVPRVGSVAESTSILVGEASFAMSVSARAGEVDEAGVDAPPGGELCSRVAGVSRRSSQAVVANARETLRAHVRPVSCDAAIDRKII